VAYFAPDYFTTDYFTTDYYASGEGDGGGGTAPALVAGSVLRVADPRRILLEITGASAGVPPITDVLQRSADSGATWFSLATVAAGSLYEDEMADAGVRYHYRLHSTDSLGQEATSTAVGPYQWVSAWGLDLRFYAGGLIDHLEEDIDHTMFEVARLRALDWWRDTALARVADAIDRHYHRWGSVYAADPLLSYTHGWPHPEGAVTTHGTPVDALETVAGYFDAGWVEAEGAHREALAKYALWVIFSRQITQSDGSNPYQDQADRWRREAIRVLATTTYRVVFPDDGGTREIRPCP
jgi:hypothetical protein